VDVPVALVGMGKVGRAVVEQIVGGREQLAGRLGIRLVVVALADQSGWIVANGRGGAQGESRAGADVAGGFGDGRLREILAEKVGGASLVRSGVGNFAPPGALPASLWDGSSTWQCAPILVDTTADDTTSMLLAARSRGARLVLANKVPLTGEWQAFEAITRGGRGARWETTVAASLPVIATLQTLLDRGDRVRRLSGMVSGTLGYVAKRLAGGDRLSGIVAGAGHLGYLEPDPRADLSGRDAARKALILARMLGYRLGMADVAVESLYPTAWDGLDLETFLVRLPNVDAMWSERFTDASRRGVALRYVVEIAGGAVRAGFEPLRPDALLARVDASDSAVVFETDVYCDNPLVISGRGGGPIATASGVLGDVVSLARESLSEKVR